MFAFLLKKKKRQKESYTIFKHGKASTI